MININNLTISGTNLPAVESYEEAVEKIPVIRDASIEDKDSINRLLNAVSAFNGIVDAGRRAITSAQSLEDLSELNKRTLNAAQTANSLAVYGQMRIGELLEQIPKTPGKRTDLEMAATSSAVSEEVKPKTEVVKDLGFSKDQVSDYQTLAKNPEVVEQVLREAKESGKVVSMAEMQRKIKEAKLQGRYDAKQDYELELERAKNKFGMERTRATQMEAEYKKKIDDLLEQQEFANSRSDLASNCFVFCNACHYFLKQYGSLSMIADHFDDLPASNQEDYRKAVTAMMAWSQNLYQLIGGNENEQKHYDNKPELIGQGV